MSARVERVLDRASGFVTVLVVGFVAGTVGGAALAYTGTVNAITKRGEMLQDLRTRCLAGNDNACTLYIAEAQR